MVVICLSGSKETNYSKTEQEEIFSAFARNFHPFHRLFLSSAVVGDSPASPAAYAPLFAQVVIDIPATAEAPE